MHSPTLSLTKGLMEAVGKAQTIAKPMPHQLHILTLQATIPMVGIGFMDNWLMIEAGNLIDMLLSVTFCLSTVTAMALGNTISDVAGIFCGGAIEAAVHKMNLPKHCLTEQQLNMKSARFCSTLGGLIGIVIGCLLGMSCLLFMDTDKADKAKKAKELQSIFESIMSNGHKFVNADCATLWMYNSEKDVLWSHVAMGVDGIIEMPTTSGLAGACLQSGKAINVLPMHTRTHISIQRQLDTLHKVSWPLP